ncbi:uncharacterized protein LOC123228008 [Mangifera indica]|uniref:uncharacterized protein LOC123228008 n=1 Tax=Mangifera indica TaxID=29780 RepID=UPI001CF9DE9E|nr:uncharacterized protein LOC123228008 [Mangifera indica]
MKQGLVQWGPCPYAHSFSRRPLPQVFFPSLTAKHAPSRSISATLDSITSQQQEELSGRERRQLRNERRERKSGYSWREEVEERLIKKPKKRYTSWTEELNLDNLATLGPQWWVVRVSRVRYQEIAERLARSLARNFSDIEFKMYAPVVQEKRKLKNGSISVKPKAIFPGCVFLRCVLNREIHDFIRECEGVGGFVGSKVGNIRRQINKPRPISIDDIEAIFTEAKQAQEKADQGFEEEQQGVENLKSEKLNGESNLNFYDAAESASDSKPKRLSRKATDTLATGSSSAKGDKGLAPGSTVRVVSGTFADFVGSLKKLNRKTKKATVGFTLFGKETLVDLDLNEIVAEKTV